MKLSQSFAPVLKVDTATQQKGKIYVVGNAVEYTRPFAELYETTFKPEEADVALFTGGSDVSPSFYGERNTASFTDEKRDLRERKWWEFFQKRKVPAIGICRGSQFLTVMNGGKLYQDVANHAKFGTHPIITKDGKTLPITSTHHQMMRPRGNYILLAWTPHRSPHYTTSIGNVQPELNVDPEIVFYPDTKTLCIQGHPESMDVDCETNQYLRKLVTNLLSK